MLRLYAIVPNPDNVRSENLGTIHPGAPKSKTKAGLGFGVRNIVPGDEWSEEGGESAALFLKWHGLGIFM